MATCQTCKGEYQHDECLCPNCEQPLRRASTVCHLCQAGVEQRRLCPRCVSDVTGWEHEDLSLFTFVFQHGGIFGLLPSIMMWAVLWLFFSIHYGPSLFFPVITIIACSLSLLTFFVVYSSRLEWREQQWFAQISKTQPPSFEAVQIFTALVGVGLGAFSVFAVAQWAPPWNLVQKSMFSLAYIPTYIFLTIVMTVSVVESYISTLNTRVPQPIFMNPQQMLMVLLSSVRDINMLGRQQRRQQNRFSPPVQNEEEPYYEVVETVRVPEDGSVKALIHEWLPHAKGKPNENMSAYVEMYWRVKSDRWGRIESMLPDSLESYQRGGRMVRMAGQR